MSIPRHGRARLALTWAHARPGGSRRRRTSIAPFRSWLEQEPGDLPGGLRAAAARSFVVGERGAAAVRAGADHRLRADPAGRAVRARADAALAGDHHGVCADVCLDLRL